MDSEWTLNSEDLRTSSYCKYYLEVEDNGPYQPKDNWWSSICDVSRMNVNKLDLKQEPSKMIIIENKSQPGSLEVRVFCILIQRGLLSLISTKTIHQAKSLMKVNIQQPNQEGRNSHSERWTRGKIKKEKSVFN